MTELRVLRIALECSQAAFAARLDVPLETYRLWDAGRRLPPAAVVEQARAWGRSTPHTPMGLPALARLLKVSVYRLREAARDGRLAVTYDQRVSFGRPIPKATLSAGETYKRTYYGKRARWVPRQIVPVPLATVPEDFDRRLRALRERLQLSQSDLAARIGAAGKAVIYQWESRKRRPSPVLWNHVEILASESQRSTSP